MSAGSRQVLPAAYPIAANWHLSCDQEFLYFCEYGNTGHLFYWCPECSAYFPADVPLVGLGRIDMDELESRGFPYDPDCIRRIDEIASGSRAEQDRHIAVVRSEAIIRHLLYTVHPELHPLLRCVQEPEYECLRSLLFDARAITARAHSPALERYHSSGLLGPLRKLGVAFEVVPDIDDIEGLSRFITNDEMWGWFSERVDDALRQMGVDVRAAVDDQIRRYGASVRES